MTTQEAIALAGSWIAFDPEFTDRPQWHECLRIALEDGGRDGEGNWLDRARSLYRRPLWEVFKRGNLWCVQMPLGIVGFKLKRSAVKFAEGNRKAGAKCSA